MCIADGIQWKSRWRKVDYLKALNEEFHINYITTKDLKQECIDNGIHSPWSGRRIDYVKALMSV